MIFFSVIREFKTHIYPQMHQTFGTPLTICQETINRFQLNKSSFKETIDRLKDDLLSYNKSLKESQASQASLKSLMDEYNATTNENNVNNIALYEIRQHYDTVTNNIAAFQLEIQNFHKMLQDFDESVQDVDERVQDYISEHLKEVG